MRDADFLAEPCVVVEDGDAGIQAADAAGIRAFGYAPGWTASGKANCVVLPSMWKLANRIARP